MQQTRSVLILLLAVCMLTACTSKYGTQQTTVVYYPACYDPIKQLRDNEYTVATGTATGAALGALGGALLGYLATGKAEGALAGAAMGGVAGGVTGNVVANRKKISDENRRMASYLHDINGSIDNLDIVSASAKASISCYNDQFKLLLAAIKQKRVSKDRSQAMFDEIQSGMKEAIALLDNAEANGRDLQRQYEQALAAEEQQLMASKFVSKQTRQDLQQAQKRTQALDQSVDRISKQRNAASNNLDAQAAELAEALASAAA